MLRPFESNYVLEIADATSGPSGIDFVAQGVARTAPAFTTRVTASGATWQGDFFGDDEREVNCLVSSRDPQVLLAVARGVGYAVPVLAPTAYSLVSLRPIKDVLICPEAGIIVFVGLTAIAGFADGTQAAWTTARLASSGFEEVRIALGGVVARYWDAPSQSMLIATLDCHTGTVIDVSTQL